jgi:chromosome partitioning protein
MARKIAIANQKGGVGKTTSTYQLASAAHHQGLKVLVIDIDPQGSLTSSLSKELLPPDTAGIQDVLSAQANEAIENVIVPTLWEGVDLVPTTGEALSYVRDELITIRMGREVKLNKALQPIDDRYDLILIDCPPSIDQLTINAMVASNQVLIVTHAAYYSLNGIASLIENIETIKDLYNPTLCIAGILINQYEGHLNAPRARKIELTEAMEQMGLPVYEPAVPKRTIIAETAENGQALHDFSSEDVQQLVKTYDSYVSKLMGRA